MLRELIVENDPKSPISEIFRMLRTNIQFTSAKEKNKTILITSASQGEGKSWITANLATVFASTGKKVLLIDCDMRLGRQYKIFNISPIPGTSNLLSGLVDSEKDVIQTVDGIENLSIIPAGDIPPNPAELLTSDTFSKILNKLKKSYDVIIVDGPPISLVTDSLLISRIVDNTVIVVENKKTKKEQLKNAILSITNVGGKIAGVVLNKAENYTKIYKNSYYYGHGNKVQKIVDNKTKVEKKSDKGVTSVIIDYVSKEETKPESKQEENSNNETFTRAQVMEMQKQMQAAYQKQYQAYIYNYRRQYQAYMYNYHKKQLMNQANQAKEVNQSVLEEPNVTVSVKESTTKAQSKSTKSSVKVGNK